MYAAVQSKDSRFDGWIYVGVTSTGIYCRPSCPAITPKRANVRFFPSAAGAQSGGFRACKRCRPDASPGSPQWNTRADVVGRAMRLIADGVVDRDGVGGLARRLGYSERHLHRQLVAEVGAGPLALARAQRAQTARLLIETTDLPFAQVAFGAGFESIRQFNDTVRDVFAATPTQLRTGARGPSRSSVGAVTVRLAVRQPFDAVSLLSFLGARAVPGVEEWDGETYRRVLSLPHGLGIVALTPTVDAVICRLQLDAVADVAVAVQRCRRLLDLDADPAAIAAALGQDPVLAPLVERAPGRRAAGHVDGAEVAVRAVLGQQISVVAARTAAARLALALGRPLSHPDGTLRFAFPSSEQLADAPDALLAMPNRRRNAVRSLAAELASGRLVIDVGADRDELLRQLEAQPGLGPWTASYIVMRALGDPDTFLPTDLGVRHAMEALGLPGDPRGAARHAERWSPWRSYAVAHLWASL
jgi:AraC family transcriptional regulator of adaptative response / DNA-3-methyladenine glycosylase II